ncbi:UDP-glucose 4-epimerase [Caenispirillum salinarum AK4]|uniref:UDP-glucose 4-epimerase n=1 Tax=Caenispirillum salinarum AK4 TaxID=1238182 RepID=K9H601_9PROT|nr:SDR family NAD(P)-dependent oxidoreductase [Caenispirillum salinarum]EKV26058.1 UDP-glucose 4-epimerase [Caenispirillum salinarum AK4]
MTDVPDRTWLITGGAGFIGSNLAERLLRDGRSVIVLDDLSTGTAANVDRLRAAGGERFRLVEADLLDEAALAEAMSGTDVIVNLAAQVSVPASVADPSTTHRINTEGFETILRVAGAGGARRIVYASSSAVFGDNPNLPLVEEAETRPMSPYAESKLANERAAAAHVKAHPGATVTGLRFFNVYGPHQSATGGYAAVIPAWRKALTEGRAPVIYGDGQQTRDFCHVSDVTAVIRAAAVAASEGAAPLYNVGAGHAVTLLELLDVMSGLARRAGHSVRDAVFEAERPGDIRHSSCDIARVTSALGVVPSVTLAEGLAPMMGIDRRAPAGEG